jgi:DNA-binding transcriptional ArsR family regulator
MKDLPDKALDQIAAYFQALSEPTRLKILNLLREQERSVGELAQLSGYSAANVSRHLSYLAQQGMVERESRGVSVFYRVSDPSIYALCDLVCGNIAPPVRTSLQRPRRVHTYLKATPRPSLAATVQSVFDDYDLGRRVGGLTSTKSVLLSLG